MALSGNFSQYPLNSLGVYCEWSASQDKAGNYSDVTISAYLIHYKLSAGSRAGNAISCGEESQAYTSPAINHTSNTKKTTLLATKTFRVYHNSDGTKSVSLSASWLFNGTYSGVSVGTITASTTVTLDPIARAAKVTEGTDFVSDANPTLKYSNPGGFTVDAYIEFKGGTSIYRHNIGNSGSYTFSLTTAERESLIKATPNSIYLSVNLGIRTTIGGVYHYSHVVKTMTVANNIVPLIGDIVWTKSSSEPNSWPLTQNVSVGTMAMSGVAGNLGSTIKSYSLTFAGYSSAASSLPVPNIASSGTLSAVAKVIDSRDRIFTKTVNFTVAAYEKPQLTVEAYRSNYKGDEDPDGEYFCITASVLETVVGDNVITMLKVTYREADASTYKTVELQVGKPEVIAASSNSTWKWTVYAMDRISTVSESGTIPTGEVVLDILANGKGIAFFKVCEGEGFDCGKNMKIGGTPIADYIVEQGTKGIWIYRKWASGIAECWGVSDAVTQTTDFDWNVLTSNAATEIIEYPFTFKNPPVVSPSVHTKSGNFWLVTYYDGTTTHTPAYQIARGANQATVTFKIGYHVFGQWK